MEPNQVGAGQDRCETKTERECLDLVDFLCANIITLEHYKTTCANCDGELYNRVDCSHYVMPSREKR